ncbi:MAG: 30S ribosomal protein S7 [Candidatus Diapherotrites archaeon]|nr:30S ribosomal protein S7 [Candidatus Diapherotrites archaeon]MDZ4256395.1 30S ribosomal protein S7 [archaeon]
MGEIMIFGKWDPSEVKVEDITLTRQIGLAPKIIPHSFGKGVKHAFDKENINVVERLINKVMRSGQGKRKLSGKYIRGRGSCGKKIQAMRIVQNAFDIVHTQTNENPIQVYVRAIENSAPREDITRLKKGGVAYSQAVDVAPLKRVDESIKNLALAGFYGSFNNNTSAAEALAKELIAAGKGDNNAMSIKRKNEIERIAIASR